MAITDNLSAWWKCSEAASTDNFADAHSTNTLTKVNNPGVTTGKVGGARTFVRASSQYATIASNSNLVISGSATIVIGFKLTTLPGTGEAYTLVGKDTDSPGSSRDFQLEAYETGGNCRVRFYVNGGTGGGVVQADNFGNLAADTWYLVRAWRNSTAGTYNIQVNATTVSTTTNATTPNSSSATFRIGARQYSGFEGYLNGTIDQVGFWQRVLTDDEWAILYNSGNWREYPFAMGINKTHGKTSTRKLTGKAA